MRVDFKYRRIGSKGQWYTGFIHPVCMMETMALIWDYLTTWDLEIDPKSLKRIG